MANKTTLDADETATKNMFPETLSSCSKRETLIIVMVGLPARGKSYIVKKLARYLNWLQHRTRVFNVGERRRKAKDDPSMLSKFRDESNSSLSEASFFNPSDENSVALRDKLALGTLDELLEWLRVGGGSIGILDATNSTKQRRQMVLSHLKKRSFENRILFLESCCYDEKILEHNIKLKLSGPDYVGKDAESSLEDFRNRIKHYEASYYPLGEFEEKLHIPYVQMIDVGRKLITHLIRGVVQPQIVEYLLNFNLVQRQTWITCNAESVDDSEGRIGRESHLSERGRMYANSLACFIEEQRIAAQNESLDPDASSESQKFCIWTSTMPQSIQTAQKFPIDKYVLKERKVLNDLNAGSMAGLTFEEIAVEFPVEYANRKRDKLYYRWPGLGGEGYVDLINRLRSTIVEVEGMTDHLLIITHRAVVRVLLAYFLDLQRDDLAELEIPRETIFCIELQPYGIQLRSYAYHAETCRFLPFTTDQLKLIRT